MKHMPGRRCSLSIAVTSGSICPYQQRSVPTISGTSTRIRWPSSMVAVTSVGSLTVDPVSVMGLLATPRPVDAATRREQDRYGWGQERLSSGSRSRRVDDHQAAITIAVAHDRGLADWVAKHVLFPGSLVDR